MKALVSLFALLVGLLIAAPIWYYLLYKILVAINASDLMFLLFWIYVPVAILGQLLGAIIKAMADE